MLNMTGYKLNGIIPLREKLFSFCTLASNCGIDRSGVSELSAIKRGKGVNRPWIRNKSLEHGINIHSSTLDLLL